MKLVEIMRRARFTLPVILVGMACAVLIPQFAAAQQEIKPGGIRPGGQRASIQATVNVALSEEFAKAVLATDNPLGLIENPEKEVARLLGGAHPEPDGWQVHAKVLGEDGETLATSDENCCGEPSVVPARGPSALSIGRWRCIQVCWTKNNRWVCVQVCRYK